MFILYSKFISNSKTYIIRYLFYQKKKKIRLSNNYSYELYTNRGIANKFVN